MQIMQPANISSPMHKPFIKKDGHNSTETRRNFRLNKNSRVSNFTSAANGSCVHYCSKNWHHLRSQRKVAETSWSTL